MDDTNDNTLISDLRDQIADHQKQILEFKRVLRTINHLCNAPYWASDRRWEIEQLSRRGSEEDQE
jgi:hypothetical protein